MSAIPKPTVAETETALTPQVLRGLQIIYFSLAAGAMGFFLVVVLAFGGGDVGTPDTSLVDILSLLNLIWGGAAYTIAWWIFGKAYSDGMFSRKIAGGLPKSGDAGLDLITYMRSVHIIRLALYEGVAFFGIIVCLIAQQGGVTQAYPVYWFNATGLVILVLTVATRFPNRERFMDEVKAVIYNVTR